jgi:dTDP-glucose 4,6-dehydratase
MGEGLEGELKGIDYIIHMAAETHVDNSIKNPRAFVQANILGTFELLELARRMPSLKKFVYFSTDEVFGPANEDTVYTEWSRYNSANPYAATKAAGEELSLAWANTYKIPVVITHTMNAFGERQHPEKFLPKIVNAIQNGTTLQIHASDDKKTVTSRVYLHCRNISSAVMFVLENGGFRDKYNIVGDQEISNLTLAQSVASILGKTLKYELASSPITRPGYDIRYSLSGGKLSGLGWSSPIKFEESLRRTINWMVDPKNSYWLGIGGPNS